MNVLNGDINGAEVYLPHMFQEISVKLQVVTPSLILSEKYYI